jgi:hypothetical protein
VIEYVFTTTILFPTQLWGLLYTYHVIHKQSTEKETTSFSIFLLTIKLNYLHDLNIMFQCLLHLNWILELFVLCCLCVLHVVVNRTHYTILSIQKCAYDVKQCVWFLIVDLRFFMYKSKEYKVKYSCSFKVYADSSVVFKSSLSLNHPLFFFLYVNSEKKIPS